MDFEEEKKAEPIPDPKPKKFIDVKPYNPPDKTAPENSLVGTKWLLKPQFDVGGSTLEFVSSTTVKRTGISPTGVRLPDVEVATECKWSQQLDGSFIVPQLATPPARVGCPVIPRRVPAGALGVEALEERLVFSLEPFSSPVVVHLDVHFPHPLAGDHGYYQLLGSGALIDRFHVITAAHMVYDYQRGGYATDVRVTPGQNGPSSQPFGVAYMSLERTYDTFRNDSYQQRNNPHPVHHAGDMDIGLITLDRTIGDRTGAAYYGYNDNDNFFRGLGLNTAGYPAVQNTRYDGSHQYHSFGPILGPTPTGELVYSQSSVTTYPGQSGSPLWAYDQRSNVSIIYGVHVAGDGSAGVATRITGKIFNDFQNAIRQDAVPSSTPSHRDEALAQTPFPELQASPDTASGPGPDATLNLSPVRVTLSSSTGPSNFGQAVTFQVDVSPTGPVPVAPTGAVTFLDGSTPLGTATLVSPNDGTFTSSASLTTSAFAVGSHTITAAYGGNAYLLASTSPALTQTVNPAGTTTAPTPSANPSPRNGAVTFTARVSAAAPGAGVPAGNVTFRDGATPLATVDLDASGQAAYTTQALAAGSHPITAAYNGSPSFLAATSAALAQTVTAPPPPRPVDAAGMFDATAISNPFAAVWFLHGAAPFAFGGIGWRGLVGDWTGQGVSTVGVVDTTGATDPFAARWYLRNSNGAGPPDIGPFPFGVRTWVPLAGDWTGRGHSGIGAFDPATATFFLRNDAGPGPADSTVVFGLPGWVPVVGDWTGNGKATIGVVDPSTMTWYLATSNSQGTSLAASFAFGAPGWKPVVGDWDGDGTTTAAVVDPNGFWYLRNHNSPGAPEVAPFAYGLGLWAPVGGHYTPAGQPLRAAGGPGPGADALAEGQLQEVVTGALARLQAAGVDPALVGRLGSAQYLVGALPAGYLGLAQPWSRRVLISADAAGYGWSVAAAPGATAAAGRMDLLTTVLHEMGHLAGLPDREGSSADLMFDTLAPGVRKTQALDQAFALGVA
jgi:V8-like Glu-specific endopeptidase